MPSPVPDRPGLLIRDPYGFSDATLIFPPALVECLRCFDGEQTDLDLKQALVQITGELDVSALQTHLFDALNDSGFLENEVFERMREERVRGFENAEKRPPAHSGTGYPDEIGPLQDTMHRYMNASGTPPAPVEHLCGIAAPHVSPEGGWQSYRDAYRVLTPDLKDRTFVVLGTSHYGQPERFGMTRKAFSTPFGDAQTDQTLIDELLSKAPAAIAMEDYCHSIEHSIEFQIVFLQHLYGPDIRILPILCGSYAKSIYESGMPEDDENVRRFLDALGEIGDREGDRLFWVLGIDMAHIGRRYGDSRSARADSGHMLEVSEKDRARIGRIAEADTEGYWSHVQEGHDPLRWCGSAPLYTFLRARPKVRADLLRYEQWNIDPQSVVSFAGIAFRNVS